MAVSKSQQKARDKWDKENMATLGCKVKRDQAERFKLYAKEHGTTANALLRDFVLEVIDRDTILEGDIYC